MPVKSLMTWTFALLALLLGTSCGSSDADSAPVFSAVGSDAAVSETTPDAGSGDSSDADDGTAEPGFGELTEGTFLLSGALDESYDTTDPDLAFRLGGGCQGSEFGVSINVTDAAQTTSYASISASLQEDLAGGVTGEFDPVDARISVFPGGDMSQETSFRGPLKMLIAEHDTGGADSSLTDRRMTIELLGSIPSDEGDLDVDANFTWVMGCP